MSRGTLLEHHPPLLLQPTASTACRRPGLVKLKFPALLDGVLNPFSPLHNLALQPPQPPEQPHLVGVAGGLQHALLVRAVDLVGQDVQQHLSHGHRVWRATSPHSSTYWQQFKTTPAPCASLCTLSHNGTMRRARQPAELTSESESVRRWRLKKEVEELSSLRSCSVLVRLPLWMR